MILHSRTISSKEVECIDSYLIKGYIVEDHDFPNALCIDCDMKLNKKIKSNGHHLVPGWLWFRAIKVFAFLIRLQLQDLQCCKSRRFGIPVNGKEEKGRPAAADLPRKQSLCSKIEKFSSKQSFTHWRTGN